MCINKLFCSTIVYLVLFAVNADISEGFSQDTVQRDEVLYAIRDAGEFYRDQVASHGGYVYFYSLDLAQRWGEGIATKDQIWVQPPGTPTVGLAFLKAYEATGDKLYLDAATNAALALTYGQLKSGGWTNCIDFDPRGKRNADYRNGKGRGKNNSSFDDGQSQSAIRLIINADRALNFKHNTIHESAEVALDALLKAQFPNGAFPQVWTGPVERQAIVKASFPEYDWRTEGRIKEYWTMYTLNDNVAGYLSETLIDAHEIYKDDRYLQALKKLGDFLLLAQMSEPQPGWAQQYNYDMKPIWARKFEPPAVAGDESQEALETLMRICVATGDKKYIEPIPRALAWLKRSRLSDGRLARYYELETNRPLYMVRRGDKYTLTNDDSDLPKHYGWKTESRLEDIERDFRELSTGERLPKSSLTGRPTAAQVRKIIDDLDPAGRWISTYGGEPLVGQAKMAIEAKYLSSEVFSHNLTALSEFLIASAAKGQGQPRVREWTDRSGKFSVTAELVSVSGNNVRLRRADGSIITVPGDKLSDADQRYLAKEK